MVCRVAGSEEHLAAKVTSRATSPNATSAGCERQHVPKKLSRRRETRRCCSDGRAAVVPILVVTSADVSGWTTAAVMVAAAASAPRPVSVDANRSEKEKDADRLSEPPDPCSGTSCTSVHGGEPVEGEVSRGLTEVDTGGDRDGDRD